MKYSIYDVGVQVCCCVFFGMYLIKACCCVFFGIYLKCVVVFLFECS